jgi:hypothetical protein
MCDHASWVKRGGARRAHRSAPPIRRLAHLGLWPYDLHDDVLLVSFLVA